MNPHYDRGHQKRMSRNVNTAVMYNQVDDTQDCTHPCMELQVQFHFDIQLG